MASAATSLLFLDSEELIRLRKPFGDLGDFGVVGDLCDLWLDVDELDEDPRLSLPLLLFLLEVVPGRFSGRSPRSLELGDRGEIALSVLWRREEVGGDSEATSMLARRVGLGSSADAIFPVSKKLGPGAWGTSAALPDDSPDVETGFSSRGMVVVTCSSGLLFRSIISILGGLCFAGGGAGADFGEHGRG